MQDWSLTFPQDLFALQHRLHCASIILLKIQFLRDFGERLRTNEWICLVVGCELVEKLIRLRCLPDPAEKPGLKKMCFQVIRSASETILDQRIGLLESMTSLIEHRQFQVGVRNIPGRL